MKKIIICLIFLLGYAYSFGQNFFLDESGVYFRGKVYVKDSSVYWNVKIINNSGDKVFLPSDYLSSFPTDTPVNINIDISYESISHGNPGAVALSDIGLRLLPQGDSLTVFDTIKYKFCLNYSQIQFATDFIRFSQLGKYKRDAKKVKSLYIPYPFYEANRNKVFIWYDLLKTRGFHGK